MASDDETSKRAAASPLPATSDSDSDDGMVGPLPPPADAPPAKKRRVLPHERLYLATLPSADMYERSYMHRDILNYTTVSNTGFIMTTSVDGHLKFWKKTEDGIEFVKHYRAHLEAVAGVSLSADGLLFATVSSDRTLKVYDVVNFDMINVISLDYVPGCVCWLHRRGQARAMLACADRDTAAIHLYDGRGDGRALHSLARLHHQPVVLMAYNPVYHGVVSVDATGMCEYWCPEEPFELPEGLDFTYKAETDLFEFRKAKSVPVSLTFSPDYSQFVTLNVDDRQVRVFRYTTGKLVRKYDESLATISDMQQAGTSVAKLDAMEFGRRLALDRELNTAAQARTMSATFDASGNFILYPTLLGIKVVNLVTNRVVQLLGQSEPHRFLNLALYQSGPAHRGTTGLAAATSNNPLFKGNQDGCGGGVGEPTLFATAYRRNRFYLFTRHDPHTRGEDQSGDRDVFNEKPSREEQTLALEKAHPSAAAATAGGGNETTAVLHTTLGDIHLKLFPEHAPKSVENFTTHARDGYYNRVLFHRIIKGFMLQTGDPLGDGTGGESIWGGDFEDEFHRDLRHDRAYTLSMANAGPNTNGSQFFITVVPTPWLDNKHTVFGRVTAGMDVVHAIENVKVDKQDRPYDDIRIMSITIR
ncbi:Peptidyl-prolyl cis-trans isomerase cyp15 [Tieghemiomyces parasiticus]|uniref:peptidylprolyl isomerase n=1 Tax=Tieghemiomyces parasiticus TaxID=78921 RepID=A0A9W8E0I0_9FUNG|nr:Peptidyl-prolyl cis-trans isomerase cyp15 [Tieghemiomyces parasiticus]